MIKTYNYTDNTQLSPHFNAQEFRCKCGKEHDFQIDDDLITKLEALYASLNCSKIIVTSGFRCSAHDKAVKGSGTGQHTWQGGGHLLLRAERTANQQQDCLLQGTGHGLYRHCEYHCRLHLYTR